MMLMTMAVCLFVKFQVMSSGESAMDRAAGGHPAAEDRGDQEAD